MFSKRDGLVSLAATRHNTHAKRVTAEGRAQPMKRKLLAWLERFAFDSTSPDRRHLLLLLLLLFCCFAVAVRVCGCLLCWDVLGCAVLSYYAPFEDHHITSRGGAGQQRDGWILDWTGLD